MTDYNPTDSLAGKTKAELTDMLAGLLTVEPVQAIREQAEALKATFYRLHRAENESAREAFDGPADQFVPAEDPQELRFKELYDDYRKRRNEYAAAQEASKEENLQKRLCVIEELKALVDGNETLGQTFEKFRELQQRWREAGSVPAANVKELWENYHLWVENFYNYVKINKELRDLDLKKNFDAKSELAAEAEALADEGGPVVAAFQKLQELHERWREVGPVAADVKDALWERFKEAGGRVNKAHQDYFEGLKQEQTANLAMKEELCVRAETLAEGEYAARKEWEGASLQLLEVQAEWKKIGFAPKRDNARIYDRFRRACDRFFERKREFYIGAKGDMEANLAAKRELCVRAEELQDSDDWKAATDAMIELQRKWKEVGPVARKYSDAVWKRFRAAADRFFERKSAHFAGQGGEQVGNLEAKRGLIAEIAGVTVADMDVIKEFQRRWNELGHVPFKQKEAVQKEYKAAMDRLFSMARGVRAAVVDRGALYNKVKRLEADIATLENNVGFFGQSKSADVLRKGVEERIARLRAEREGILAALKTDQE